MPENAIIYEPDMAGGDLFRKTVFRGLHSLVVEMGGQLRIKKQAFFEGDEQKLLSFVEEPNGDITIYARSKKAEG